MFKRNLFGLALIAALLSACASQTADIQIPGEIANISDDNALTSLSLHGTQLAYHVIDADTGGTIISRQENDGFPPASTAKIPTMIAALGILGADYSFRTDVAVSGRLSANTLEGDVFLIGSGDPLLSASDLRSLALKLSETGIQDIKGRFVYHSRLPEFEEISETQPADAPYNQGISGLNVDFNRAFLTRTESSVDTDYTTPEIANAVAVLPKSPRVGTTEVPVRAPAKLSASMFRAFAAREGTILPPGVSGDVTPGAVAVATIYSQPLLEIARAGLLYSNNLVSETIGLAAAREIGPIPMSLRQSALQTGIWLEREVTGLDRFALNLRNHSGLSSESRIAPIQMTTLLRHAHKRRINGWRFDELLPVGGGRDGFRGGFRRPEVAYKVWAKTGNMMFINGLAGYLDADSGRRLIFTSYLFDQNKRAHLERVGEKPTDAIRRDAELWRDRADILQESLITRWISAY